MVKNLGLAPSRQQLGVHSTEEATSGGSHRPSVLYSCLNRVFHITCQEQLPDIFIVKTVSIGETDHSRADAENRLI